MIERKNPSKIEEKTETEYQKMVEEQRRSRSKIMESRFKPGMRVAVSIGEAHLDGIVRKGETGIYIVDVKNRDGTTTPVISTESEMDFWN